MFETQKQFWDDWAEAYRGFSEIIEPYREAQRALARSTIDALGEGAHNEALYLLDVGGGAGNTMTPVLEMLASRRGNLKGVTYVLTDGSKRMVILANGRLDELKRSYPDVEFRVIHTDTLSTGFVKDVGHGVADVVISSWNIEYYPPAMRQEIVTRLVHVARERSVVAFSSIMRLPGDLTIRDVLMPLGGAQVVFALLTGGPQPMRKVIAGLKLIADFGAAAADGQFPEKPTLDELKGLAGQAGLASILAGYHLYGASGMVVARKDNIALTELPESPIAEILSGKEGYDSCRETIAFLGYLRLLLSSRQ